VLHRARTVNQLRAASAGCSVSARSSRGRWHISGQHVSGLGGLAFVALSHEPVEVEIGRRDRGKGKNHGVDDA
jgi:hypothetical protein